MSAFNPTLAASLAQTLEEADSKATPAPYGVVEDHHGKGRRSFRVNDADGMWVAECDDAENDAHSIATLRNHARQAAEQLRAACAEVERLLSVAYAANYFVDTREGITQLYDAVRDLQSRTDFAHYRDRETRIRKQSDKIGNLEWDVKELRDERDHLSAKLSTLEQECGRMSDALKWVRTRLLDHRPGSLDQLFKANTLAGIQEALDALATTKKDGQV